MVALRGPRIGTTSGSPEVAAVARENEFLHAVAGDGSSKLTPEGDVVGVENAGS